MKRHHWLMLGGLLVGFSAANAAAPEAEASKPASHSERELAGWTVRVDDRLLTQTEEELSERILKSLEAKLFDIATVVPADRLAKLREVTIVADRSHGRLTNMQYHPSAAWLEKNGFSVDLARCVHLPVAKRLLERRQIDVQPWVILHELVHAYHDQVLGFDEPRILEAYREFVESGRGEDVLHVEGHTSRHYGLTDHKEFFAEMSEAYFGTNDFHPFHRGELKTAEPRIHALMESVWRTGKVPGPPEEPAASPGPSTP